MVRDRERVLPEPMDVCTLNPNPKTPNPQPDTLNRVGIRRVSDACGLRSTFWMVITAQDLLG